LTDLDRCQPASSLSREGKLSTWRLFDYETEEFRGVSLRAGPETAALPATYPLQVRGWHDVYVGFFNTAWRPFHSQRLWIKLSDDAAYSLLHVPKPTIDHGQVVQELFWKTADLTDRQITFEQISFETAPTQHGHSSSEEVWIFYFKLVPLSPDEEQELQADRRRTDTRRLIATQDVGTGMLVDASPGHVSNLLESYRHTDFRRIDWEGAVGDLCSYFTKVGRMWTPEHVPIEDFPLPEYRLMVKNWSEYLKSGVDPFRIAVDHAHNVGIEFHAAYRFAEGMGPFHFSPPFDEINRGGFYEKHPELRAVRRDGTIAPRISMTFPEARRFVVALFGEMAQYPIDGVSALFNRRPPFAEYEPPLVESFLKEFGKDPRKMDENEPAWLQHRCSVMTSFLRELRAELDRIAEATRRSNRLAISTWVFGKRAENLLYGLDVETWIREGLVDTVIPYTSAENLFSFQAAWENPEDVAYWVSLTRGTACQLALNIMPRNLSPELYREKAHTLFEAGVGQLAFWDSAKVWGIEHDAHSAFYSPDLSPGTNLPSLARLGHLEELKAWIVAGKPSVVLPAKRLKNIGDWEMTFVVE
jgi:hypothetical protein